MPLDWARTHVNLGTALVSLAKRDTSADWLKQALAAHREALRHFDALSQRFGIGDATLNAAYAACLAAEGRDAEADAIFCRAIASAPEAPDIARDYAAFLMRSDRHAEAACVLETIARAPGADLLAISMLVICRLQLADWRDVEQLRSTVVDRVTDGLSGSGDVVPAYDFLAFCDDPLLQRRVAERWASTDASVVAAAHPPKTRRAKLRLGFVSSDYNNHPVARLVIGLFERLD